MNIIDDIKLQYKVEVLRIIYWNRLFSSSFFFTSIVVGFHVSIMDRFVYWSSNFAVAVDF
jgi:hypothetical protein